MHQAELRQGQLSVVAVATLETQVFVTLAFASTRGPRKIGQ